MTHFELNLALPEADMLWFSEDSDEWTERRKEDAHEKAPCFLAMLKRFWNSSSGTKDPSILCPRGSRILMCGIMSIVSETRLHDDNTFANGVRGEGIPTLSSHVHSRSKSSFPGWPIVDTSTSTALVWRP
jgi:hypothetical protein